MSYGPEPRYPYRDYLRAMTTEERLGEALRLLRWWFDTDALAVSDRDRETFVFVHEMAGDGVAAEMVAPKSTPGSA